jgi:pyridoxine 5-phosphate synthase
MPVTVVNLSVNIDHIATLRQARGEDFPDPVHAAVLVELGGADGVTVHLRQDRRHINERDVELLRRTVKSELTVEMAATEEMVRLARRFKPDQVTLVPELTTERTTTRGLDAVKRMRRLAPTVKRLRQAGIRVSMFIEPEKTQIEASAELGAEVVELNTDRYSRGWRGNTELLAELAGGAELARNQGLEVHVGHGLGYLNVAPIVENDIASGYSIGFAIVARSVMTGLRDAVAEMKRILEVRS